MRSMTKKNPLAAARPSPLSSAPSLPLPFLLLRQGVVKVDKLAKGLALNSVILMEAKKLIEQSEGMPAEKLVEKLQALEEKRMAGNLGMAELKACEAYSAFAEQFVEGDGDDDIVCSSASAASTMKDPFSQTDFAVTEERSDPAATDRRVLCGALALLGFVEAASVAKIEFAKLAVQACVSLHGCGERAAARRPPGADRSLRAKRQGDAVW